MKAAIYNIETGLIRIRVVGHPSQIDCQCQDGEDFFLNCPDSATRIAADGPVTDVPTFTIADQIGTVTRAIQNLLDATARSRNYDSMVSLASYANSTNAKFQAEALAGISWRDACWSLCYERLAAAGADPGSLPTPEEALTELPVISWPAQ